MASFSLKIKTPKSKNLREWMWVLIIGVVLAVIALISEGSFSPAAGNCQVTVAVDSLNERTAPSSTAEVGATFLRGRVLNATTTVESGFRELRDGNWVSDQGVTPVAGTVCS